MVDVDGFEHLLGFEGDPHLKIYYRSKIENVKDDSISAQPGLGVCDVCKTKLSRIDQPRLKPPQKLTKVVQKLMNRSTKKLPLTRFEHFKLKKFLKSYQEMTVKCPECQFVNHKQITSREQLVKMKSARILEVQKGAEEERGDEPQESKKRKRKKKKKKKDIHRNPNSLISDEEDEEDQKEAPVPLPVPVITSEKREDVSLSQFLQSQTKEKTTTSIFQKAIGLTEPTKKPDQSPGISKQTASSKTTGKKTKPVAVTTKGSKIMHKQLKKFLSTTPVAPQKASLKDFLKILG